jgi:hypothetical protein
MENYLGVFAYSGKDGTPETVYFSLTVPEGESDTADESGSSSETLPEA